tara:strand:- start:1018 stop:1449 length:432 start_codon:yes stop_codon:yes gene_type:complete
MWRKIRRTEKAMAALLMLLETMMNNVKVQMMFQTNLFAVKGWVQTFEAIICDRLHREVRAVEKWFNETKCMDAVEECGIDHDDETSHVDMCLKCNGDEEMSRASELRALHREILRLTKTLKTVSSLSHVPWRYDIPAKELLGR